MGECGGVWGCGVLLEEICCGFPGLVCQYWWLRLLKFHIFGVESGWSSHLSLSFSKVKKVRIESNTLFCVSEDPGVEEEIDYAREPRFSSSSLLSSVPICGGGAVQSLSLLVSRGMLFL